MSCGLLVVAAVILIGSAFSANSQQVESDELGQRSQLQAEPKLTGLFSSLKHASGRSMGFLGRTLSAIPFGKIALVSGALLSIFFLFVRLLIVMGPILILGALTRESTEPTDLIKMLIEFYNQLIVALDEQQMTSQGVPLAA